MFKFKEQNSRKKNIIIIVVIFLLGSGIFIQTKAVTIGLAVQNLVQYIQQVVLTSDGSYNGEILVSLNQNNIGDAYFKGKVKANLFCDESGNNCKDMANLEVSGISLDGYQKDIVSTTCLYGISSINDDGNITCAGGGEEGGIISETDPIWMGEKAGYLTTGDAENKYQKNISRSSCNYGIASISEDGSISCAAQQSISEIDPIWESEKIGYLTTGNAENKYQKILSGNLCEYGILSVSNTGLIRCSDNPNIWTKNGTSINYNGEIKIGDSGSQLVIYNLGGEMIFED